METCLKGCRQGVPGNSGNRPQTRAEALRVAASIGDKADKNKHRGRAIILFIATSGAAIPVLIGLSGSSWILAKVIPSILGALTVAATTWNQFERPHERWVLYRRYHRLLQTEIERYQYRVGSYEQLADDDAAKHLGDYVSSLQMDLHYEWEGLIAGATK